MEGSEPSPDEKVNALEQKFELMNSKVDKIVNILSEVMRTANPPTTNDTPRSELPTYHQGQQQQQRQVSESEQAKAAQSIANAELIKAIAPILQVILGGQQTPYAAIIADMTQRQFYEDQLAWQYTRRAQMRQMFAKGWITEQEWGSYQTDVTKLEVISPARKVLDKVQVPNVPEHKTA